MAAKTNQKSVKYLRRSFFWKSLLASKVNSESCKHLRWIFLRKLWETKCSLFLQNPPSWMFDKILNIHLNWIPKVKRQLISLKYFVTYIMQIHILSSGVESYFSTPYTYLVFQQSCIQNPFNHLRWIVFT